MSIAGVSIIESGYDNVIAAIGDFTSDFSIGQVATATALGGVALGAGVVGIIAAVKRRKPVKRKKARKKKTKKGRRKDRKFISKQKHEISRRRKRPGKIYGKKGKYYSRKPLRKAGTKKRTGKIYYTKKGQPFKILASGKARFIKKTKRRS